MKRDMRAWSQALLQAPVKKPLPILAFPAVQLMGIPVRQLIGDSDCQARGMQLVAQRTDAAAAVSLMDLSVEAECFGADIRVSDGEVPTIVGRLVQDEADARALAVPPVGSARSGLYIQALQKALTLIDDRPVLAGAIGPFSLAARLLDVTEIMVDCYDEPDLVHLVLQKATAFLLAYCAAYKQAGANGIMLAEPVTGLLSPALAEEFSTPYVRQLVEALQDDHFSIIYHNCGNNTVQMADSILATGAAAYHFGNAIDLAQMLEKMPRDTLVMGNLDPAGQLRNGTPDTVRAATLQLMQRCGGYPNFVVSSGCDIPPLAPWENIDAFFDAVRAFYDGEGQ